MAGPGDRIEESSLRSRPARLDEGGELTELAVRAKSHWGYDPVFLDAARAELTIDAETIGSARVYVLDHEGTTIGFYGLVGEPPRGRLEWLFLEPAAIGLGYGRWMWDDAIEHALAAGAELKPCKACQKVGSHPHSEGWVAFFAGQAVPGFEVEFMQVYQDGERPAGYATGV